MRRFLYTAVLLLSIVCGCTLDEMNPSRELRGALQLSLQTQPQTRAVTPGDGDIYTGGGMEDLTLILVNSQNRIADIQILENLQGEEQKVMEVTFLNLIVGNYTVYAYANTKRSLLSEVRNSIASLKVGDSFGTDKQNALFTALQGRNTPVMNTTAPLLLTAVKQVSVQVENTGETIEMLRPIVLFEVNLFNHSDRTMKVTNVAFSKFNPSTGYVLSKDGSIPASVTYRDLPTYATFTGGTDIEVPAKTRKQVYGATLFENRASSYTLSLNASMDATGFTDVTAITSTSEGYLLQNRATGKYLADNGNGTMVMVDLASLSNISYAQWKFNKTVTSSSTTSGYMTNVGSGKRFYRSITSSSSGSNLSFAIANNTYLRINYYSRGYYYLQDLNGTPTFSTNFSENNLSWKIQQYRNQTSTASLTNSVINVIDQKTAAVVPMREQLRNQHISVTINGYYNEIDGAFDFTVVPWTEKNEEVEFN